MNGRWARRAWIGLLMVWIAVSTCTCFLPNNGDDCWTKATSPTNPSKDKCNTIFPDAGLYCSDDVIDGRSFCVPNESDVGSVSVKDSVTVDAK